MNTQVRTRTQGPNFAIPAGGLPAVRDDGPPPPAIVAAARAAQPAAIEPDGPLHYPPALTSAVLAVVREIGTVGKFGRNTHNNYDYQKWDDILARIAPLLAEHGLIITQTEINRAIVDGDFLLSITYQFHITNEHGDQWPIIPIYTSLARVRDMKGVYDDKAANKCHTQGHKYFLINFFKIPSKDIDDNDADGPTVQDRQQSAPPPRQAAKRDDGPPPPPKAQAVVAGANPETGEVGPYEISTNGTTFPAWRDAFVAACRTAKSFDELTEWKKINGWALQTIQEKAPSIATSIEGVLGELENDLAAREPAGAHNDGSDAGDVDPNQQAMIDAVALEGRMLREIEKIARGQAPMQDLAEWGRINAAALAEMPMAAKGRVHRAYDKAQQGAKGKNSVKRAERPRHA